MKTKYVALFSLALTLVVGLSLAVPVFAATFNPNKLNGAPNYVLNMLGKKDEWSGGGSYDNPDRHTMFVPETTTGYGGTGKLVNTTTPIQVNLTMWITQGDEFAVLDGNGFDEDHDVDLQLGPGKYAVFVVALGKPVIGSHSDIRGWIYNETAGEYLFMTGMVTVQGHNKRPAWVNATDLLFVSPSEDPFGLVTQDTWIFEYLTALSATKYGQYLYLWDLDNQNIRHLQLRFYQIG